ncbi:MAG: excalibur calcium-binding domain-containing protein [Croceibacterium sp.]
MRDWEKPDERHWGIYMEFWALLTAVLLAIGASLVLAVPAFAHPGGFAADGCHNDRKAGTRHCHGGNSEQGPQRRPDTGVFANCTAARNAGAAPVRRGDPGYGRHLDRDGDGVGCE